MPKLSYNPTSKRMVIGDFELHAGYPVTVIHPDGSKFETRIELDDQGWYLVDLGHDIIGLDVEAY